MCPVIALFEHITQVIDKAVAINSTVDLICNPGYHFGNMNRNITVQCQLSGDWKVLNPPEMDTLPSDCMGNFIPWSDQEKLAR